MPADPQPNDGTRWQNALSLIGLLAVLALLILPTLPASPSAQTLSYTDFTADVTAGTVATATIDAGGGVTGTLVGGAPYRTQVPTAITDASLAPLLAAHKVAVTATPPSTGSIWLSLLSWAPLLLIGGWLWWSVRRAADGGRLGGLGGVAGFGSARTIVPDEQKPRTRFTDIAGYEGAKAEVMEVVDFLRNPGRYAQVGAKGPKGVLLVGPPGTGKTLIARAVAGEAGVPFFAVTGSSFVEMFVGVGASRVRSLFEQARKAAPAIVFVDEIDAIGARRSIGGYASNDERVQTLNQLLAELDGFDPASGVVVMAATNRADTLDAALLRPGRFDRTVEIPLPTQPERSAILARHCAGKSLAPDVDLGTVARGTPGFSGADLANLVNEAAINAVRDGRISLTAADLDAARDRLVLGRRDPAAVLQPGEQRRVAVHEAGHALVALLSEHADPVAKVTILPRGAALGATQQLPQVERRLYPSSYLEDALAVRLGGRAAELLVTGEASSGAADDLRSATDLATHMVREWGLSERLGPIGYGTSGGEPADPFTRQMYSEATQNRIDEEVARLLREAESAATTLLDAHRSSLDRVVAHLIDRETVDGDELALVAGITRTASEGAPARPVPTAPDVTAGDAAALPAAGSARRPGSLDLVTLADDVGVAVAGTAAAATPQDAPPPGPPTPIAIIENENPLGLVDGGTDADDIAKNAVGLVGNAINTVEVTLPPP